MTEAVIALGANLGEPKKALEQALKRISKIEQTILLKASSFYRTAPVDSSGPDYVNAVVTVETELEPASFTGDEDLMQHLWINLLSNAVKYTPAGGSVTVTLKNLPGKLSVCVADTGRGIAKEDLDKIFDKYYQTDKSHSKRGLGLGLAIVKRIVQLCGGEISVTSTPGEGSAFTVTLPNR